MLCNPVKTFVESETNCGYKTLEKLLHEVNVIDVTYLHRTISKKVQSDIRSNSGHAS